MNYIFTDRFAARVVGIEALASNLIEAGDCLFITTKHPYDLRATGRINSNLMTIVSSEDVVPDEKRFVVELVDPNESPNGKHVSIIDLCKRFLPLNRRMDLSKMSYYVIKDKTSRIKMMDVRTISRSPLVVTGRTLDDRTFHISYSKGQLVLDIHEGNYIISHQRINSIPQFCDNLLDNMCTAHAIREFGHILGYGDHCYRVDIDHCSFFRK